MNTVGIACHAYVILATKVIVQILDPADEIAQDRHLNTATDRPAVVSSAAGNRRNSLALVKVEIGDDKSARNEKKLGVECISEAATHVTSPVHVVSIRLNDGAAVQSGTMCIGPAEVAFNTEDSRPCLPVVSRQHAADDAIRRRVGLGDQSVFFDPRAAPQIANVAAEIEAAPIIWEWHRCGRRSLHRHVGRRCNLRTRDHRNGRRRLLTIVALSRPQLYVPNQAHSTLARSWKKGGSPFPHTRPQSYV